MRPKLKISNLIGLQDARSSAAVGFDLISFNLERGSHQKLSVSLAWNIVQWLSGPDIVLELNRASLPELEEARKTFEFRYITMPLEEWENDMAGTLPRSSCGPRQWMIRIRCKTSGKPQKAKVKNFASNYF